LGLIEAVNVVTPVASAAHAGLRYRLVVFEERGAPGLLGGDPTQANALVGEKHRGASEQKLAELKDRIQAPALEKQDAAAEQAHGGKEHVVIAGQGRLEIPHEIEECTANGQNDPNNAGPIQAGVDHRSLRALKPL
jgi:hypothetical protein